MNKKLIAALVIGIVLSLGLILIISTKNKTLVNNIYNLSQITTPSGQVEAMLTLKPSENNYLLNLSVVKPETLTALSIRLTYKGDTAGKSFTPNPELVAAGWVFPVKEIVLDTKTNTVNVDISAINPSTSGYNLNGEVNLGTLNNFSSLTLGIDKGQTKILTKAAKELNYTFK